MDQMIAFADPQWRLETWLDQRTTTVMRMVADFVAEQARGPEQRQLLERAAHELEHRRLGRRGFIPGVHLPLLVHAAATGRDEPALPVALATTLIETGTLLLDHIADGELGPSWADTSPGLVLLAATGFLCSLPQLALSLVDAPAELNARLHEQLARGFVAVGRGQQLDLLSRGATVPDLDRVRLAVDGKSGQRRAMYTRLVTELAGLPARRADAFCAFGHALGVVRQLESDCRDLFSGEHSRDLAAGTRTWPLTWWLVRRRQEGPDALDRATELLARARTDLSARDEVRGELSRSGVPARALFEIEIARRRALRALDDAEPLDPAGAALRTLVSPSQPVPRSDMAIGRRPDTV